MNLIHYNIDSVKKLIFDGYVMMSRGINRTIKSILYLWLSDHFYKVDVLLFIHLILVYKKVCFFGRLVEQEVLKVNEIL